MAGSSPSNLFRKAGALTSTGVVLAPRVGADFAPRASRAVLPKAFIHHAEPAGAIDRFFAAWEAAWQRARGRGITPRQRFVAAAHALAEGDGCARSTAATPYSAAAFSGSGRAGRSVGDAAAGARPSRLEQGDECAEAQEIQLRHRPHAQPAEASCRTGAQSSAK